MSSRLRHAAELLRYSNSPIDRIIERWDFTAVITFIVTFVKLFGMTPGAYRHGHTEAASPESGEDNGEPDEKPQSWTISEVRVVGGSKQRVTCIRR